MYAEANMGHPSRTNTQLPARNGSDTISYEDWFVYEDTKGL
jgi:hypothetical protein